MSAGEDKRDLIVRLERVEAREAIRDLIHRYALRVRTGAAADNGDLFAADAIFETHDADPLDPAAGTMRNRLVGRDAIIAHIGGAAAGLRIHPSITNVLIEIERDTATATCLLTARIWPGGGAIRGAYRDCFVFDGVWRFQSRICTMFAAPA